MLDTPDPENHAHSDEEDLEGPGAFPHVPHVTETHKHREQSHNYSKGAEHVVQAFKAVGRSVLNTVNWIDQKGTLNSAAAAVFIAVLTAYYVHYSRSLTALINNLLTLQPAQRRLPKKVLILLASKWEGVGAAVVEFNRNQVAMTSRSGPPNPLTI